MYLLTTVRDWLRAGADIYALDIGQVTSELDIVLVIKGWQGGDERQKIRERTSRGRTAKAKAGKVVGGGTPPYGYKYSDGELFIEESQAQVVRMIYDWYVNGNERGGMMSLVAIAEQLTKLGIPAPAEGKKWVGKYIKHRGWHDESVWRILVSETYCGTLRYGKRIGNAGKGGTRPFDERIPVSVPAIITRETWERAQARRAYNSRIAKRKMKHEFLLRGLIYCGCGQRMTGSGRTFHYYCPRRYPGSVAAGTELCTEPVVKGKLIECITWDYILNLIKDPQRFEESLRKAQAKAASAMQPKQKELEHVIALIRDTEQEADEIARAATKVKGLVGERLAKHAEEVDKRYQALTTRRAKLLEALNLELTDRNIENMLEFRETVALGLDNPRLEDKRQWLEMLQARVIVTNQKAVITCRLGGKPLEYNLFELHISNG